MLKFICGLFIFFLLSGCNPSSQKEVKSTNSKEGIIAKRAESKKADSMLKILLLFTQ